MTDIAELYAPPEVLEALRHGKQSGQWVRAKCPYCDPEGRKRPNLVASHTGYGCDKNKPGWTCHACQAQKVMRSRSLKRGELKYDGKAMQADEAKRKEIARSMFERSGPVRSGDVIDTYLRKTRGLRPCGMAWPSSIRYLRGTHASDRDASTRKRYDIMLCSVVDSTGQLVGIHRTFLNRDGTKSSLSPNKMTMGIIRGGAVRLGVDSESVIVAEGVESAQAAWMMLGEQAVPWSTISAGGMHDLQLPDFVKRVFIVPDRDKNKVGQRAGFALLGKCKSRNIEASIHFPPAGLSDYAEALER